MGQIKYYWYYSNVWREGISRSSIKDTKDHRLSWNTSDSIMIHKKKKYSSDTRIRGDVNNITLLSIIFAQQHININSVSVHILVHMRKLKYLKEIASCSHNLCYYSSLVCYHILKHSNIYIYQHHQRCALLLSIALNAKIFDKYKIKKQSDFAQIVFCVRIFACTLCLHKVCYLVRCEHMKESQEFDINRLLRWLNQVSNMAEITFYRPCTRFNCREQICYLLSEKCMQISIREIQ